MPDECLLYPFSYLKNAADALQCEYINESANIFAQIEAADGPQRKEKRLMNWKRGGIYKISAQSSRVCRLYRRNAEAFVQRRRMALKDEATEDSDYMNSLFDSVAIWTCAEALYFHDKSTPLLAERLMEWVNKSDPQPDAEEGVDIMSVRPPCSHPSYWNYILRAVLRGLNQQAALCLQQGGLLNEYPDLNSTTLQTIADLLRNAPRGSSLQNTQECIRRWKSWLLNVQGALRHLRIANPVVLSGLRKILEILSGHKPTIYGLSESWYEALAAVALFSIPFECLDREDVIDLCKGLIEDSNQGFEVDTTLDYQKACAALCTGNVPQAIFFASSVDIGLGAQLADLLDRENYLAEFEDPGLGTMSLRDHLLLEVAELSSLDSRSWTSAVIYWHAIGELGINRLAETITHVLPKSEEHAYELLDTCSSHDLREEHQLIAKSWAKQMQLAQRYSIALRFYEIAESYVDVEYLCWNFFQKSLSEGRPLKFKDQTQELLDNPSSSSAVIATIMAPYGCLQTYYRLQSTPSSEAATNCLISLLTFDSLPRKFVPMLIAELCTLFQGN